MAEDWRAQRLAQVRALIREADPDAAETVKWRKPSNPAGVPVWEHDGILLTGETYRDKVKLTFAQGAALEDSSRLFNSSLDGNTRRAIEIREGDAIDEEALKALVRAAGCQRADAPRARRAPDRGGGAGGQRLGRARRADLGHVPHGKLA